MSVACTSWQIEQHQQHRVEEPLGVLDQPQQRAGLAGRCPRPAPAPSTSVMRVSAVSATARNAGDDEQHRRRRSAAHDRTSSNSVARVTTAPAGSPPALGQPVVRVEQLSLAGAASRPPPRGRRGPCRARAARRARRAARSRRRRCRRGPARCARRPPGTPRRRRAATDSSGSGSARSGPARPRRATARLDESSSIGNASTSVGPSCVHEPLVELGDRRLVDEQQRQLGLAAHALGARAPRSASRAPASRVDGSTSGLLVGDEHLELALVAARVRRIGDRRRAADRGCVSWPAVLARS